MKKLLVIVDMQNDFINGALGTKEARAIIDKVKAKQDSYAANGGIVVFTRDTHGPDYLSTQEGAKLPVAHCIKGSHGWQITDKLCTDGCKIIDKPSFGSLELGEYVSRLAPVSVELVGLCTDICVISNAMIIKAAMPELPVMVDAACCAGVTPQSHKNALEAMKMCQIEILG